MFKGHPKIRAKILCKTRELKMEGYKGKCGFLYIIIVLSFKANTMKPSLQYFLEKIKQMRDIRQKKIYRHYIYQNI